MLVTVLKANYVHQKMFKRGQENNCYMKRFRIVFTSSGKREIHVCVFLKKRSACMGVIKICESANHASQGVSHASHLSHASHASHASHSTNVKNRVV